MCPSVKGSFVPVQGSTRAIKVPVGRQTAKCKNYDIIGIERLVTGPSVPNRSKRQNMIKTLVPEDTFLAQCSTLASDAQNPSYARTNLVHMHWGLIPVEYKENFITKRKVFHVLRVIPQPGFHLLDFIRRRFFEKRHDTKHKDAAILSEVCHHLQQVVNYEADINLGMLGVWDSKQPNPWCITDPLNPTSVQRILSPFTVLSRLLHHIPGGFCGTHRDESFNDVIDEGSLIIHGFPDLTTPQNATEALKQYKDRQELYLKCLRNFELEFEKQITACNADPDKEAAIESILSVGQRNYNLLDTKINMTFMLQNYMKFSREKLFADSDRLTIPKLGIAMIDLFVYFETNNILRDMNSIDFITAHVGEQLASEVVTETRITMKYRVTDIQSLEDFPKAGQYKSARDGYKRNAAKLVANSEQRMVNTHIANLYTSYLRLQYTATMNGLLMDSWMSDRVYKSATILDQLVGDMCPCKMIKEALQWADKPTRPQNANACLSLIHDHVAYTWARMNAGLCILNETIKANPLNLAIIWGMLKSDVLTFLGLHNQTWRWIMYCMQVAPCFGHLRTQTEDGHAARGECILTAKPNSVGLNEVIVKTVNYCLEGLLSYIATLTDEDRRVLRLDKVDRRTRAGMEASQVIYKYVFMGY